MHKCSSVNYLHISRIDFQNNTSDGVFGYLILWSTFRSSLEEHWGTNLFIKSYSKFIGMQKSYYRKSCMANRVRDCFCIPHCFVWKTANTTTGNNRLFQEKLPVLLKIYLFVVFILFSRVLLTNYFYYKDIL